MDLALLLSKAQLHASLRERECQDKNGTWATVLPEWHRDNISCR